MVWLGRWNYHKPNQVTPSEGMSKMHTGKYWYLNSNFQHRLSDSEQLVRGGHYGNRLSAPTELPQKDQCINAYRNNSRRWLSETRMNKIILIKIGVWLPAAENLRNCALWPPHLKTQDSIPTDSLPNSSNYLTQKTSVHLGCNLIQETRCSVVRLVIYSPLHTIRRCLQAMTKLLFREKFEFSKTRRKAINTLFVIDSSFRECV